MVFFESVPVLTLFRPRCVWSKGKAMGQSVQLLMETLRPGSERRVRAGAVARAAGRGRWGRGGGKGLSWDPGSPPGRAAEGAGAAGSAKDSGSGKGLCTGARPRHWWPSGAALRGRGWLRPQPDGQAQLHTSCSRKGLKGVTGARPFAHLLVLEDKNTTAAPASYTNTKIVTDWSTGSYKHRGN